MFLIRKVPSYLTIFTYKILIYFQQWRPFVYTTKTEDGGEIYQGFCIDLMDRLSELMGFSYRLYPVEDGQFGGENDDGSWTGLVGDLINRVSNSDIL